LVIMTQPARGHYRLRPSRRSILPGARPQGAGIATCLYWSMSTWSDRATMNLLIVGNGETERAWAIWLLGRRDHRLDAVFPGFGDAMLAGIPVARDLEDALARPRLDAVIVGGPWALRGLALRRAAAEGFAVICLHPPGPDSEAYYQVALSREE